MKLNVQVEVRSRAEKEFIEAALKDPQTLAFVKIVGALLPLKSDRARARVLNFVYDHLLEEEKKDGPQHVVGPTPNLPVR